MTTIIQSHRKRLAELERLRTLRDEARGRTAATGGDEDLKRYARLASSVAALEAEVALGKSLFEDARKAAAAEAAALAKGVPAATKALADAVSALDGTLPTLFAQAKGLGAELAKHREAIAEAASKVMLARYGADRLRGVEQTPLSTLGGALDGLIGRVLQEAVVGAGVRPCSGQTDARYLIESAAREVDRLREAAATAVKEADPDRPLPEVREEDLTGVPAWAAPQPMKAAV